MFRKFVLNYINNFPSDATVSGPEGRERSTA